MVSLDSFHQAQERLRGVAVRTPLIPYFPPQSPMTARPQYCGSSRNRCSPSARSSCAGLTTRSRHFRGGTSKRGDHLLEWQPCARRSLCGTGYGGEGLHRDATQRAEDQDRSHQSARRRGRDGGRASSERRIKAEELARENGYAIVPPYDDEQIISGQGTVGLEIFEDLPDVDVVLVPVGGGGLISGVSAALKMSGSKAKVDRCRARAGE